MIDLIAATAAAMLGVVGATGFAIDRKTKRSGRLEEDRCTGYEYKYGTEERTRTDCKSLRNPTCTDGRCSFHCQRMCRCDLATGRDDRGRFVKK